MKIKINKDIIDKDNVFFTSDEHYNHKNIIKYCNRPFKDVDEMNSSMIHRFNVKVPPDSITFHLGDFYLGKNKKEVHNEIISKLNGQHIFLMGSHDSWLDKSKTHEILELRISDTLIVMCHYAMLTWAASHYNSWHLYGHSHGGLTTDGKTLDVGVDTNDFFPYSIEDIRKQMTHKPDNPNLVK